MKKIVAIIVIFIIILSVSAVAEGLDSIIPDATIWGISADAFKKTFQADYEQCQVGEDEALRISNVEVYSYNMDVYYVFDGTANKGLSKIAYIYDISDFDTESELDNCFQTLVEEMKRIEGEPDTVKNNTSIWKNEKYKIELGKGKLSKYTGTDQATVAIIFKQGNISEKKAPVQTAKPKTNQDNKKETSKYSGPMVKVKIGNKTVEIHKSFKEAMDKYEDFFDRYINFLKNPDFLKYSEIMLEYAETIQALEEMEDDDLTTEELAYYMEVYARIMNKLSTFE